MTEVGRAQTKHVNRYLHTGWREINHRMCYLDQGGAIGADSIDVDLGPGTLTRYALDPDAGEPWDGISQEDAVLMSMRLMSCMPAWVYDRLVKKLGSRTVISIREKDLQDALNEVRGMSFSTVDKYRQAMKRVFEKHGRIRSSRTTPHLI